jgi:hypothetical protein
MPPIFRLAADSRKIIFCGTKKQKTLWLAMKPSPIQQLAMQAKLNMHMGAEAFDRIFLGAEFGEVSNGVLNLVVNSNYQARQLRVEHMRVLIAVGQDILGHPVHCINVSPRSAFRKI